VNGQQEPGDYLKRLRAADTLSDAGYKPMTDVEMNEYLRRYWESKDLRDPVTGLTRDSATFISANSPYTIPEGARRAIDANPSTIETALGVSFFDAGERFLDELVSSLNPFERDISERERLFRALNLGSLALPMGWMIRSPQLLRMFPALRSLSLSRKGVIAASAVSEGIIGGSLEAIKGPDEEGRSHVLGSTLLSAMLGGVIGGASREVAGAARKTASRLMAEEFEDASRVVSLGDSPFFTTDYAVLLPGQGLQGHVATRGLAEMADQLKKGGYTFRHAKLGNQTGLMVHGIDESTAIEMSRTLGSRELLTNRGLIDLSTSRIYPLERTTSSIGATVNPALYSHPLVTTVGSKNLLFGPGLNPNPLRLDTRIRLYHGKPKEIFSELFPDTPGLVGRALNFDIRPWFRTKYARTVRATEGFRILQRKMFEKPRDMWQDIAGFAEVLKTRPATLTEFVMERGVPKTLRTFSATSPDSWRVAGEAITRGVSQVFSDIRTIGSIDDFRQYGFYRMYRQFYDLGLGVPMKGGKPAFTRAQVDAGIAAAPKEWHNLFDELSDIYQEWQRFSLVDSGILPPETFRRMWEALPNGNKRIYIPLKELKEDVADLTIDNVQDHLKIVYNPVKFLAKHGKDTEYADWIQTYVERMSQYARMADEQRMRTRVIMSVRGALKPHNGTAAGIREYADNAERLFGLRPVNEPSPIGNYISRLEPVMNKRTGEIAWKQDFWQVTDERLWDSFKYLGPVDYGNWRATVRGLSLPATLLRTTTTVGFEFLAKNPVRDMAYAWVTAGLNPLDVARGMASLWKKDDFYWAWKRSGGPRSALVSMDRNNIREAVKLITEGRKPTIPALHRPSDLLMTMQGLSEGIESWTRLGMFRKTFTERLKDLPSGGNALQRALFDSAVASKRSSVNFSMNGAAPTANALRMITAFWNAGVQGIDQMAKAAYADPKGFVARGGLLTAASVGLYLHNRKDEDIIYGVEPWEKMLFWHFRPFEDGEVLRIPKPFEAGILFSSIPEAFMEALDRDSPEVMDNMAAGALRQVGSLGFPMPTAIQPIWEILRNRVSHTGAPIVSEGQAGGDPGLQAVGETSKLAIAMARFINQGADATEEKVSPLQIEHIFRSYTGGLARPLYKDAPEFLYDAFMATLTDYEKDPRRHYRRGLGAHVGARAFASTFPYTSASVNRLYELGEEAAYVAETARALEDSYKTEDLAAYLVEHGRILQYGDAIETAMQTVTELADARDAVLGAGEISMDDKRRMVYDISIKMHRAIVPFIKLFDARSIMNADIDMDPF